MNQESIRLHQEEIVKFCEQYSITEFALFGSILYHEFKDTSDVDILVTFKPEARYSLFDLALMQEELKNIFGCEIDLVEKASLRNPFRRHHILHHNQVLYAAN